MGIKSSKPSDLLNNEQGREPVDNNNNNNNEKDEKETKVKKKYYGKLFVIFIFFVIVFQYYTYVYLVMWNKLQPNNVKLILSLLFIFHILLLMMLWSLLVTMNTHPGEIPLYWGFYIGDDDSKKKRYCLICNAFKPERSHHCSVCNICVLNMDHHCPWVDNCIGFYNRKYFMQLLFYLSLLTIYIDFSLGYDFIIMMKQIFSERLKYKFFGNAFIFFVSFGINVTLSVLITMFFKFHVKLVIDNSTTIESLDKEKIKENKKFSLSTFENWVQVFGEDKVLWFFPIISESGRPKGDGLTWKTNVELNESMDRRIANNTNLNNTIQNRNYQNNANNENNNNNQNIQQNNNINSNLNIQNTPINKNDFYRSGQYSTNNQYFSTNQYNSNANFIRGHQK